MTFFMTLLPEIWSDQKTHTNLIPQTTYYAELFAIVFAISIARYKILLPLHIVQYYKDQGHNDSSYIYVNFLRQLKVFYSAFYGIPDNRVSRSSFIISLYIHLQNILFYSRCYAVTTILF
jgi:hypothetical protein